MNRRRRRMAKSKRPSPMKEAPEGSSPPLEGKEEQGNEAPEQQEGSEGEDQTGGIASEARSLMDSGVGEGPQPPASQSIRDPILKNCELKIESQMLPQYKQAYSKVVVIGMKLALADNGKIITSVGESKNPLVDCARGAVNLVLIMYKESRRTMPPQVIPPAAMTLMLKALDFCDRSGVLKIGEPELETATKEFANYLLHRWNMTPKKMHILAENVHRVMSDPGQVEMLARKSGVVRDPRTMTGQPAGAPPTPVTTPQGGV